MQLLTCEITKPITPFDINTNRPKRFEDVNVENNPILDKIMEAEPNWIYSPIIWVHSCPYKIQLIEMGAIYVILCQSCIRISYENGRKIHSVLNHRLVKLTFL